jgi:hypothetical protein
VHLLAELLDRLDVVPDNLRLVLLLLVGKVIGELRQIPDLDITPADSALLLEVLEVGSSVA